MIASAPLEHYKKTLETVLADDGVDMVAVIYLPFLGLKDIDVAKAVMEIRTAHPDKPIVGVFMTKNEFFAHLSETEVNVPFFMFAEQAVEGLARLNQQRLWRERTETPAPRFSVVTEAVEAVFSRPALIIACSSQPASLSRFSLLTASVSAETAKPKMPMKPSL